MKAYFKKRAHDRKRLAVHALDGGAEDTGPAAEENNYFYELNTVQATSTKKILTGMYLNGVLESFEVDSGAAFTVISETTWNRINLGNRDLRPSNIMLQTWSKEKLNVLGSARVNVEYNKQKYVLSVLVIAGGGRCLLGRDWFDALGITVHGVLTVDVPTDLTMLEKKYNSVFNEHLGAHNGPAISLEIVQGAQPIFRKYRPCPIAWKPAVEREIEKLVAQKVLEPTLFSHWATPIVPVIKKDGTMRICGDYRSTVNAVIKPNTYPLPLFSEVKAEIAGAKLFTKLDLQQAYQQLDVDDFASPGLFQKYMDNLLAGVKGVKAYLDDIIISGKDENDHFRNLEVVLKKLEGANLTVNKANCSFARQKIDFLGYNISHKGISPNEEKVRAIKQAPTPKNKEMLQSFLGLLNFYNAFLPMKSSLAENLHRLLDKDSKWSWTKEQQRSFEKLKALINSDSLLVHYDVTKPLVLSCDASPYGLGAVLVHRSEGIERPIAFASRTLGVHERNYAQIDREALAIIFGVKHFHQYIAGREVIIVTDHKPLLGIFNRKKQIPQMLSPRMLRWCLLLAAYDYQLEYRPGQKHANADCLSRLPLSANIDADMSGPADVLMLELRNNTPIKAEQIAEATSRDPIMSRVLRWLLHGWPQEGDISEDVRPFIRRRSELSTHKGCLLWGSRVIIPPKYRNQILELLHGHHPGICAMKAYARSYVWWPELDKQIEMKVAQCEQRQIIGENPPAAPRQHIPSTDQPWETLHIDFAGPFQGNTFLVVVDAMSKWLEVKIVSNMSSMEVKHKLREIIATHGLPKRIISDNGTAFSSAELRDFYSENGIKFHTSAPYHPSSNGQAERMVQYLKKSLNLITHGDISTRLQRVLLKQHSTPHTTTGKTPAELLMGRRIRTLLDLLHPDDHKLEQRPYVASGRVRLFDVGDPVYFRNYAAGPLWLAGKVIEVTGPVSYVVQSTDMRIGRRHVDQIKRRVVAPTEPLLPHEEKRHDSRDADIPVNCSQPPSTPLPSLPAQASIEASNSCSPLPETKEAHSSIPNLESKTSPQQSSKANTVTRSGRHVRPPRRFEPC
ncbi:PREDICTED: uncharacterized protein K02A2.6-like [Rhagoletis zephyria]|uniref:uncharacterized protein K02A2.6-like n=1 Tax=Rhagoletis zephyria TaxID=28612 RepID=UPI000811377E|nr:PREDICTED: uncharacterized protein K02A2.6-like [Rhagoletis zephyria]